MSPDPSRPPDATAAHAPDAPSTLDVTGAYDSAPSTEPATPHGPPTDLPDVPGYEVTGEIARGGMGRVLAARDPAFGREVAIKVLLPGAATAHAARLFARESYLTGRLTHPGIPPAHQLGSLADGSPFLAMKLVRGRTLADLLKARPTPTHDLPRFVGVFEQVCQAVGYAHSEGVVHRDIKPANVMVGAFGEVQVMDWGLARENAECGMMYAESKTKTEDGSGPDRDSSFIIHHSSLTAAGQVMGTPAYMAPEQARGEPVDARADVFALGGVLGEVLTGHRTFAGTTIVEVVKKAAAGDVADAHARLAASGADRELIALATRCLSPAREARPADGTAVAAEVAAYRAGVEERMRTAERERAAADARAAEQRKRRRVQLALAATVVLLVAGAGGVAVWRVQEDADKRAEAFHRQADDEKREREGLAKKAKAAEGLAAILDRAEAALRTGDPDLAATYTTEAVRRAKQEAIPEHAARVAACQRDLAMLRDLDRIDTFRWTPVDAAYPPVDKVVEKWAGAFAGYGIIPGAIPPAEAAVRITTSPIRVSLVAALDRWQAWIQGVGANPVREILAAVDPDPFRAEVRRLLSARDVARLEGLAGRPGWTAQPAGLVHAFATSPAVPVEVERTLLTRVVAGRSGDFALLMTLGSTYPLNTPDGASDRVRWFQAGVAARPGNAAAHLNLGSALRDTGDSEAAILAFREALRLEPGLAPAHANLGNALTDRGELDAAVAAYREAIKLSPGLARAHANLGIALTERGELDAAVAAYREAIKLDPVYAPAHANLGYALAEKGDVTGGFAACREAIKLDPRSAYAHANLGYVLSAKRDADGAVAACREAIRLDPKLAPAHRNLGDALADKGEPGGAVAAYREAIRLDPRLASAHNNLGMVLRGKGELDGAIAAYREAIRIKPAFALAHNNLGIALRGKGELDGAIAAYREAIRLNPKLSQPHSNLGAALTDKRDLDGAIAAYREAIRLDPKLAIPHNNLGNALRRKGDADGAVAAYREAIRLDPKYANAHSNLGVVFESRGELTAAEAEYREALRLDPKLVLGHLNLGDAFRKQGRLAEAAAAYREALVIQPTLGYARAGLAYVQRLQRGEVPTAPPPREVKR